MEIKLHTNDKSCVSTLILKDCFTPRVIAPGDLMRIASITARLIPGILDNVPSVISRLSKSMVKKIKGCFDYNFNEINDNLNFLYHTLISDDFVNLLFQFGQNIGVGKDERHSPKSYLHKMEGKQVDFACNH